ncbi:acyl-coenzyme A diphosphatase NUDT19-like [Homalodisca vitripennis]|uniref:acyl-coenzyme A diphosphatase NUDT19-like n=1 Tax=Homalodisca vitripennis TaxID=197043 RepID=UPI001EEB781B|nr:acyl-coenzyme A diphosphatase NUDT19-like [Homalodisca vitripennis]KAG8307895.1 Nucleoside diphosphate-linked moiety X motif 19, mitochondrial [Homalodisca vitripennis]
MNRWKEASSLIISAACKNQIAPKTPILKLAEVDKCNFEILALKKRSTPKPQLCVFPGGSVSIADSVQEWEGLFSKFGLTLNVLSDSLANTNILKLPIFNDRNEDLPRWLSLRITAIRETFEECGILLCKSKQTQNTLQDQSALIQDHTTNHFEVDNIESWRSKVLDDPFQFLALCEHFNCYPDVENLYLWSNWLTPSHMTERFDAVFFFTNMNHLTLYRGSPDYKEIESSEWFTPEELLDLSHRGEIWLKPPQWYEIKELLHVKEFTSLHKHSFRRSNSCLRWMPVRIIALDGEISLLPGDEMYPNEIHLFKSSPIVRKEESMASLRCEKMHRMEHTGVKIVLFDTRSDCR